MVIEYTQTNYCYFYYRFWIFSLSNRVDWFHIRIFNDCPPLSIGNINNRNLPEIWLTFDGIVLLSLQWCKQKDWEPSCTDKVCELCYIEQYIVRERHWFYIYFYIFLKFNILNKLLSPCQFLCCCISLINNTKHFIEKQWANLW